MATDSQAAVRQIHNLQFQGPKSWIDEDVVKTGRVKVLTWVKGHSGTVGNELAELKVKEGVALGRHLGLPNIATPVGIKHFPLAHRSNQNKIVGQKRSEGSKLRLARQGLFEVLGIPGREE